MFSISRHRQEICAKFPGVMLPFIRNWYRGRLRKREIPPEWFGYLEKHIPFFAKLETPLRESFLEKLKIFAWEKNFIGGGDFEITDEIRVVVSAVAVRLILHLDISRYDRLSEIVVYPHDWFRNPKSGLDALGEAHDWGVIVLSWPSVLDGLANPVDGHDTGLHEFAHSLDRSSGEFDGTPVLRRYSHYRPWVEVMSRHFLALRDGSPLEKAVLDDYGAINEAEFFATITELFFERPEELKRRIPDLYEELLRFYGPPL